MKKFFSMLSMFIAVAITTISCSSDDEVIPPSTLATITDFTLSIDGLSADDIVYDLGTNITVAVPYGTSLIGVVPNITLSNGATISPASGEEITFVDGEPKTFTVTAEDGTTTKEYTVTVNVRGELGSGSKLKTYTLDDIYRGNLVNNYTYNEANFISEISSEISVWGDVSTIVYSFIYNDKNQIIEKKYDTTVLTYLYNSNGQIESCLEKEDDLLKFEYLYTYNNEGYVSSIERKNYTLETAKVDELDTFEYDTNGNVIKTISGMNQSDPVEATYDTKNNPFKGMYPVAYGKIEIGLDGVNNNNPISRDDAASEVSFEYNTDDYPVESSYTTGFDYIVAKTYTYYSAE